MNGIERAGADWWRLTKDGSLELIKETSDKFNLFFDTEGYLITSVGKKGGPMQYMYPLMNQKAFKHITGKKSEFVNLRIAQTQLIAFAIFSNRDVYETMVERAKATHWYNRKLFQSMVDAGDLGEKRAANGAMEMFKILLTQGAAGAKPMNAYQVTRLGGTIGSMVSGQLIRENPEEARKILGEISHKAHQHFINNYQANWRFIMHNIPSTPEAKTRLWGDRDSKKN